MRLGFALKNDGAKHQISSVIISAECSATEHENHFNGERHCLTDNEHVISSFD